MDFWDSLFLLGWSDCLLVFPKLADGNGNFKMLENNSSYFFFFELQKKFYSGEG